MTEPKKTYEQLKQELDHAHFDEEALIYFADSDGDPIGLLEKSLGKLRELFDCDQVIYRDLEKTVYSVNRPGVSDELTASLECCEKCVHFPTSNTLYDDGMLEVYDVREGYRGIPISDDCPAKSILTSMVYLDGEAAGYVSVHYLFEHHHFTDLERETLSSFTKLVSMSLSRYTARQKNLVGESQRGYEYAHAKFRAEALAYFADNDGDPLGFLETFVDKLRELFDCDQVSYRNLEREVVVSNRPGMDPSWHVPITCCDHCAYLPGANEMYGGGIVEVHDSEKALPLVPKHPKCPAKAHMTSIVDVDGKRAGYLTLHFLREPHKWTNIERRTISDFTKVVAISLSRYRHRLNSAELEEQRVARKAAEAASAAKTNFLSAMSHDIRTPMNAITGMADIALHYIDDQDRVRDCLNKIKTSGNQLISLVNNVLDISAIESGKAGLKPVRYNIPDAAARLESSFQTQLRKRSQKLVTTLHDISHPYVMADDVRVRQVYANILDNAIKYSPEGSTITFEVYQTVDSQGVLQSVGVIKDCGIGMSQDFMDQMWDLFVRATDTRINEIQGVGLGLSIVKQLIDLMGGTVEVESKLGEGTTFRVSLPLEPIEEEEEEVAPSQAAVALELNVLMAEDNDLNWEISSELLSLGGVECVRAENGQVALEKFTQAPEGTYDAILMDMQMPVMNGIEATKAIRASSHPQAQSIPILAVTANAFSEDAELCREAGMNDHLSKPIDVEKVLAALSLYTTAS